MQTKKQSWSERIKRRNRAGFSLVELIVIIAMMAILAAVLTPSLLAYVERSRAQKDLSAMDEVVNAVFLAMADPYVYDELVKASIKENVSCYIDTNDEDDHRPDHYLETKESIGSNKAQYMFDDNARLEDETKFYAAGNIRGTTITFKPNMSSNKSKYVFGEAVINRFFPDEAESINNLPRLYNAIRSVIGDSVNLTSQTYRNSEYTIFVKIGTTGGGQANAQDAMQAYGQFSGTNLSLEDREYYIANNRNVYEPEIGVEITKLETPEIAIDGGILNITAVDNATEYKVFSGDALLASTSATSVDLSAYLTEAGTYTLKVQAVGGAEYTASDFAEMQYVVSEPEIEYVNFTVLETNRHMIGYTGKANETLVIPETFQDDSGTWRRVVKIGQSAFSDCTNLTSIIIPNSVTSIDGYAFYNCSGLTGDLIIPDSVTSIGMLAFKGCSGLNGDLIIGNGVTSISISAFDGCRQLTSVTIGSAVESIGSRAFEGCSGLTGDLIIPDSVTSIGDSAFESCSGLDGDLIIGSGLRQIGERMFYDAYKLKRVVIGDSVTTIGSSAFWGCTDLTSVTIGSSVTSIGEAAFQHCTSLNEIKFVGTAMRWVAITKGDRWNSRVPASYITCIGGNACMECAGGTATCQQKAICSTCGNEYGSIGAHSGGTATCQQKAICATCGHEYGSLATHSVVGDACVLCGKDAIVIESAHNPYAGSQMYVVIGTWDFSDATSVTITITYQTESSKDWVSITEGTDYVSGSSYIDTRNYLHQSGSIVSVAGTAGSVQFGGTSQKTVTFTVDMLTGSVVFKSDYYNSNYYGVKVIIVPNYD